MRIVGYCGYAKYFYSIFWYKNYNVFLLLCIKATIEFFNINIKKFVLYYQCGFVLDNLQLKTEMLMVTLHHGLVYDKFNFFEVSALFLLNFGLRIAITANPKYGKCKLNARFSLWSDGGEVCLRYEFMNTVHFFIQAICSS